MVMLTRNFFDLLAKRRSTNNVGLLCVGLDPSIPKPDIAEKTEHLYMESVSYHMETVVRATRYIAAAYKPNLGFYLCRGARGIDELHRLCQYIRMHAPETPIIIDGKFGDIGKTNEAYARFAFDFLGADAVTLNPYVGGPDAFKPFLERAEKCCIFLCRTSNPEANLLQGQRLEDGRPLYMHVAEKIALYWSPNDKNLGFVVGATAPSEMKEVRRIVGDDALILAPGIGTQGGEIRATLENGLNSREENLLINVSSGITNVPKDKPFEKTVWNNACAYHDAIAKE
jgi:orotidine-5'-phosphate decarboxylase